MLNSHELIIGHNIMFKVEINLANRNTRKDMV